MPNHCFNSLSMSEGDLSAIVKNYVREDEKGELIFDFEKIEPIGNVPDWYEQRMNKWGTKWIGYDLNIGGSILDFYTAWSPPVPIIKKLAELHKDIAFRLEYYELGCAFRGVATAEWQDGEVLLDDQCWEITEKDLEELGFSEPEDGDAPIAEVTANEKEIDYNSLFEIWGDFDDAESPKEVMRICNGLGYIDTISFMAFCYGYEKAIEKAKAAL